MTSPHAQRCQAPSSIRRKIAWVLLCAATWCMGVASVTAQYGSRAPAMRDGNAQSELADLNERLPTVRGGAQGEKDEAARTLFEFGRQSYDAGRYEEAANYFEQAFRTSPRAELLINAGNAWAQVHEFVRAIEAYRLFLRLAPSSPDRPAIEQRVAELEYAANQQGVAVPMWNDSTPAPTWSRPGAPERVAPPPEPEPSTGLLWGRTYTWVTLGVGALSLGMSAYFWSDASSEFDLLAATCGRDGTCSDAQLDGLSSSVQLTNVFLGVGLASLTVSAVLFFLEGASEQPPEPSWRVAATSDSVALHYQGQF